MFYLTVVMQWMIYSTGMSCNFYDWFKIYYYATFQSFYILIDKFFFCIYGDGTEDQGIWIDFYLWLHDRLNKGFSFDETIDACCRHDTSSTSEDIISRNTSRLYWGYIENSLVHHASAWHPTTKIRVCTIHIMCFEHNNKNDDF